MLCRGDGDELIVAEDFYVQARIINESFAEAHVEGMLEHLSALGDRFVATRSSNARALPTDELAARARPFFASVEARDDPVEAVALAHALGEPVLVTGSLYLLADLEERSPWR